MNQYEKRCWSLAGRLRPITAAQMRYAEDNLPAFIVLRRGKCYCSECGCDLVEDPARGANAFDCPECERSYTNESKQYKAVKGDVTQNYYYGVNTVCGGEQLTRHWIVAKTAKVGEPASFAFHEVSRDFVGEHGEMAVQGLSVTSMAYIYDKWIYGSEMKPRDIVRFGTYSWYRHNISDYIVYSRTKASAWARMRGYDGEDHGFGSIEWKYLLATEPFVEWLVKRGHSNWLDGARLVDLKAFRRELELCDKHGYEIADINMWIDTVSKLRAMGRDTLNAKWSRFPDLAAAHDKVMAQAEARRRREERARQREEMMEEIEEARKHAMEYAGWFGKFGGLLLSDGTVTAVAITDVDTLIEEGETMHHCAATYYDKPDSLIFSILDADCNHIATVEWSLSEGRILQCRGKYNSVPDCYDDIVQLVTSGKGLIEKAKKFRKSKKVV